MDNKIIPFLHYDEEKARTSKSPILIALTELQKAVLIEVIWKQQNDPNTTWCIERLDVFHTDVTSKYKEKKFTHYVWVLSEDNVRAWLKTISKHKWNTEDVLEWEDDYQMVYNKQHMSSRTLQYLLNEVVDDYVRSHGDPRSATNVKIESKHLDTKVHVAKQKMLSAKHCGVLHKKIK